MEKKDIASSGNNKLFKREGFVVFIKDNLTFILSTTPLFYVYTPITLIGGKDPLSGRRIEYFGKSRNNLAKGTISGLLAWKRGGKVIEEIKYSLFSLIDQTEKSGNFEITDYVFFIGFMIVSIKYINMYEGSLIEK